MVSNHRHQWFPVNNMDGIQTGTLEVCAGCGKEQGTAGPEDVKRHNDALDKAIAEEMVRGWSNRHN